MINKDTKVIVQGLGKQGIFHTKLMLEYGTKIVAGVNPNSKELDIPVFKTVKETLSLNPEWSVIFVPAKFCKGAAIEALNANLNLVIITEGVPVTDMIEVVNLAKERNLKVLGGNCPGMIRVSECKLGIMPGHVFKKGSVGLVSRSGTLTYEIVNELTRNGLGQSLVVGIGGDMINGMDFVDVLKVFEEDSETEKIVLLGEIGGDGEERAAEYIKSMKKPVVAYIAGKTAPKGKRMGHAGAIIYGEKGTYEYKVKKLRDSGVIVANLPSEVVNEIKK